MIRTLANAAERLLNAEAEVLSVLRWMADKKREAITEKVAKSTFKAKDLTSSNWRVEYLNPEAEMKIVAVESKITDYFLTDFIRDVDTRRYSNLVTLSIYFMQDPDDYLKSKKKLTDAEKKILRELKEYYDVKYINRNDGNKMDKLNSELIALKHGISIVTYAEWEYSLDKLLSDNFLFSGLRCGMTNIC